MKNFLKQKLKNKFILILIIFIISILWFQAYKTLKIRNNDTNSYVVLVKWKVKINDYLLKKEERKKLKVWDKVITWQNSACVIEWWDWSLTRLWENWKIEIQQLDVSKDLSKINLQFKLVDWKTWSNVVSFLWEDSYFKQNFEDIEAAVRWTIFDVNLTKDYVYVANHEVKVKKWNNQKTIKQNQAFSISKFSFINLQKFIKNIKDKAWEDFNQKYDEKYFEDLQKNISKNINLEKINKLISENANYQELLSQYQKLNFIKADNSKLFEMKNKLKEALIQKAPEKDKQTLVRYSIYDLKDALNSKNLDSIKSSFSIISENKDIVKKLWIDFNKDIFNNIWKYWENIKNFFQSQSSNLKDILWEKFNEINVDFNLDDLWDKANKLRDNAINWITNLLK